MKSWEQRERARVTLSKEVGYVTQAARRPPARRPGVPEHLLGRDVEPRLPDGLPPLQRPGRHRLRAVLPAAEAGTGRAARDARRRCVTLESQTPVGDFDVDRVLGVVRVGLRQRADAAAARRHAALRRRAHRAPSAGRHRRRGDVRQPRAAGAVRRRDRRRRGRSAGARASRARSPRRPAARDLLRRCSRASAASTCRRSTSRSTRADGTLAGYTARRGRRRAAAGAQGGAEDDRRASIRRRPASSRPTPSSDRASSSKSSAAARTCAASAGPATTTCRSARFPTDRILQLAEAARVAREPRRPGVDRALRSSRTSSASSRGCTRWATRSARRRCASTI